MTTPDELARKARDMEQYFAPLSDLASVSPDYARIQLPLTWGGIWQTPGLDLKLRSFVTISAQCVVGVDNGLRRQIRAGLNAGITPQQIKGIFIQLLFYAGIPATVNGLLQAQEIITEREEWQAADIPLAADWLDTLEEKLQRASEIRSRLWGERANQEVESSFAQRLTPEASDIVDGYNFGEVWARDDLSPKERMVCVLAVLTARSHWKELRRYIRYALNMEFTHQEICQVLVQAGWYSGWPHVEDALEEAQAVFDEEGD